MNPNDCGQPMCNMCTKSSPSFPCVGVPGAADPLQTGSTTAPPPTDPIWTYGNKTYVPVLQKMDADATCSTGGLGLYAQSGSCIAGSQGVNNANQTQKAPLLVNSQTFTNFTNATTFPLQALHKVWGDAANDQGVVANRGVNSKNVYVSEVQENVTFNVGDTSYKNTQPVMIMEAHGDKYSGTVPGLMRDQKANAMCYNSDSKTFSPGQGKTCSSGIAMPQCTNWKEIDSSVTGYNTRVGGVACTRNQYGPGVYNLLCYVPKTEDTSNDGRGYVFAIWPFHYEEVYNGGQKVDDTKVPCFNQCDGATPSNLECPSAPGSCSTDVFSAINHEIDIEIPSNSPQLDWKTQLTWNTMNANTWLNDIDRYTPVCGAYYTQVAIKNASRNFISDEPESSDQKDYHWYTIDWYVDPNNYSNNYVAFYFDDPWDPSGSTTITSFQQKLPTTPRGQPVFKTNRFVPTRSGRLNVGPWMGWWGYGFHDNLTPQFDTAKVRLAQLSITPYASLWNANGKYLLNDFPQSYDQPGASCDFQDLAVPQPAPPTPTPPTPTSNGKGLPIWVIVVIVLGIIVLALISWAIADAVKRKKQAKQ